MVFVFYNKVLLRALVFLIGALAAVCAWHYIGLSALKLGTGGVRDALAIVSFLAAGWLVLLIAEVADHHYVRALGAISYLVGAFISYRWIFVVDAPKLAELQGGAQRMQFAALGFWSAAGLALLMLAILVTRLVIDKLSYGRLPEAVVAPQHEAIIGVRQPGQGEAAAPEALAPIPVDVSPLAVAASPPAGVPTRMPAPVTKLVGIAGSYAGMTFPLATGETSIGRQASNIELAQDSQVSRSHASVSIGPDGLATLRDQGSTNGTWVNNERVGEIVLAPGDTLQFGTSQFRAEA